MENLIIEIGANTQEFIKGLGEVATESEKLNDSLKGIGIAAGLAFAGYSAAIYTTVAAYAEQEQIANQLNAVLKATGGIAGVTADQVKELSDQFVDLTAFSDDAIQKGEKTLLTFTKIGKEVFPEATRATLDLAAGLGKDVSEAALLVGKALQDPINGTQMLRRAGIDLTATQKEQIQTLVLSGKTMEAQTIVLKEIENRYAGQAEAVAAGTGVFLQLKNVMEQVSEEMGSVFAPILVEVATGLKEFFKALRDNPELVKFGAYVLGAAAAITGLIASVAGAALAFIKLQAILPVVTALINSVGVSARVAAGATGIGLLVLVAVEVYQHWSVIWPAAVGLFNAFVDTIAGMALGLGKILIGAFKFNLSEIREGIKEAAEAFAQGVRNVGAVFKPTVVAPVKEAEDAGKAIATAENRARIEQSQKEEANRRNLELQSIKATQAATILELQGNTTEIVALKRKEGELLKQLASDTWTVGQRQIIRASVNETQAELKRSLVNQETFRKEVLASNEKYNKLDKASQDRMLASHAAAYKSKRQITEEILAEELVLQTNMHNQYLANEEKFGEAYAEISRLMHSEIYKGSKTAFGELAQLQNSSNAELKAIGKAAAIANIGIKTAESAMAIFAGFSTIPIIGPALGLAGAAAAIAYGAEQVGSVLAANKGGRVTGGVRGIDSVPALLTPGELVVPEKNFEEVVSSVQRQRENSGSQNGAGQSAAATRVVIEFKGEASRMLQVKALQDRSLGTYRG